VIGALLLFIAINAWNAVTLFGSSRVWYGCGFFLLGIFWILPPLLPDLSPFAHHILQAIPALSIAVFAKGSLFPLTPVFSRQGILGLFLIALGLMTLSWVPLAVLYAIPPVLYAIRLVIRRIHRSHISHLTIVFTLAWLGASFMTFDPLIALLFTSILSAISLYTEPLSTETNSDLLAPSLVFLVLLISLISVIAAFTDIAERHRHTQISLQKQRAHSMQASLSPAWLDSLQGDLSDYGRLEHRRIYSQLLSMVETQPDIRMVYILQWQERELHNLIMVAPRMYTREDFP